MILRFIFVLEALAALAMSAFAFGRGSQSLPAPVYRPGEWNFSSDHLPVIMDARFSEKHREKFATFNVLNKEFKEMISTGNQKLAGSLLDRMPENERTRANLAAIDLLIANGVSFFVLQEVSSAFLSDLQKSPSIAPFELIQVQNFSNRNGAKKNDFGIIAFRKDLYTRMKSEDDAIPYSVRGKWLNKYIHRVFFTHKASRQSFWFVHSHVEFGAFEQFTDFLKKAQKLKPGIPVIAAGDFNVGYRADNKYNVKKDLMPLIPSFKILEYPGFSHVNTKPALDCYDHFLVSDPTGKLSFKVEGESQKTMKVFQDKALGIH